MKLKMVSLSIPLIALLVAFSAHAIDFSGFDLTQKQKDLLARLEARGTYTEQTLLDLAASFQRSNHPYKMDIPEHTPEQVEAVTVWGEGGAYSAFAKDAGFEFDRAAYLADCPNLPLFGFGKANGTAYLNQDVLRDYYNAAYELNRLLFKEPSRFRDEYLRMIEKTPFKKYISEKK